MAEVDKFRLFTYYSIYSGKTENGKSNMEGSHQRGTVTG